ncbi:uncharacterized protein BBOV_IV000070 [Babesia bovis T2Bo]|uniref:Microprotein domain-containing protein n=1 Tax=Babesia bovis TaxID=5865 RepID=A7AUY1_BABBO|nr:uncharacterized protein BBOV_IV000070 [Babesia bovis T2Bo]EDO05607.1 hypothetical protein BBOV_IV000070 [Babesia bovis T2Bo]|eukprot:XP_001609175.1 hypothetical protein [Babesia bovis T2Bo]
MTLVIGLVGALGEVVGAIKEVVVTRSTTSGKLKGALENVIEVVLLVVNKLVEGVEKKNKGNGKVQAALGKSKVELYGVWCMNVGMDGKMGKARGYGGW